MELFLNIVWLLVALGILGAWRVRWVRQIHDSRRSPIAEWTAIGCALVLLFFAISLTDDLHYDIVLFSESATSRRHSSVLPSAHDSSRSGRVATNSGAAVLPRTAPRESLALVSRVIPLPDISLALAQHDKFSARAPPITSL